MVEQITLRFDNSVKVLNDDFKEVMNYLYPTWDYLIRGLDTVVEKGRNDVEQRTVLLYGKQGVGKTQASKKLIEEAVSRYGKDKVNAKWESSLAKLFTYGWFTGEAPPHHVKPINIFIAEDMTLQKHDKDALKYFFKIRHLMKEMTGYSVGLVIIMITLHRFYGVQLELRTETDLFLFRSAPTSPYDYDLQKRFVGEDNMECMESLVELRNQDDGIKGWTNYYINKKRIGWMFMPLATLDHSEQAIDITEGTLEPIKEGKDRMPDMHQSIASKMLGYALIVFLFLCFVVKTFI